MASQAESPSSSSFKSRPRSRSKADNSSATCRAESSILSTKESRQELEDKDDLLGNRLTNWRGRVDPFDGFLPGFEACERRNEAVLLDLCTSMLASSIKALTISASDLRRRLKAKLLVLVCTVLSHGVIALESGWVCRQRVEWKQSKVSTIVIFSQKQVQGNGVWLLLLEKYHRYFPSPSAYCQKVMRGGHCHVICSQTYGRSYLSPFVTGFRRERSISKSLQNSESSLAQRTS